MYDVDLEVNGQRTIAVLPSGEVRAKDIDKMVKYLENEVIRVIKNYKWGLSHIAWSSLYSSIIYILHKVDNKLLIYWWNQQF